MGQSRSYFVKGNVSEAHRITEYIELEMTHEDHHVQVVAFHTWAAPAWVAEGQGCILRLREKTGKANQNSELLEVRLN